MPLLNILTSRTAVTNSQGQPVRGGLVVLNKPGSTTELVTGFKGPTLISAHAPVTVTVGAVTLTGIKLTGSGKKTIWVNEDCDLRVYDRNNQLISTELNVNPDSSTSFAGGLVPNGSFEIDTDTNNIPDGWTLVNFTASSNSIDTSQSTEGGQSFRFTSSGSGGGTLTTTEFFAVNDTQGLRVNFDIFSTVADVRNIVRVQWYDISQVFISNTDVYDNSTTNPTSWERQTLIASPPSGARFAKLQLIGCDSSDVTPGSTYFDQLEVIYPIAISGIFDNITIQNNEIISTNTNGEISLETNGTGEVRIDSPLAVFGTLSNSPNVAGSVFDTELELRNSRSNNRPVAGFGWRTGGTQLEITNYAREAITRIEGFNASEAFATMAELDPDEAVTLFYNNSQRFRSSANGIEIVGNLNNNPSSVPPNNNQVSNIQFQNQSSQIAAYLGLGVPFASPVFTLLNQCYGGGIEIKGLDSTGNEIEYVTFGPTGGAVFSVSDGAGDFVEFMECANASGPIFYHNANERASVEDYGLNVHGSTGNNPASGGGQNTRIEFQNTLNQTAAQIGYNTHPGTTDGFTIKNFVHSGSVFLVGEDTGGTQRTLFSGDPDGASILHNVGVATATTTTAALGGLRANNTATASGFERVLTVSDTVAPAVTDYTPATITYLHDDGGNSTTLDALVAVVINTWESIGPTGSLADNIWTALDALPTDATHAILSLVMRTERNSGSDALVELEAFARQTGSAAAAGATTKVADIEVYGGFTTLVHDARIANFEVPLDGSRRFDFRWFQANQTASSMTMVLKGFRRTDFN